MPFSERQRTRGFRQVEQAADILKSVETPLQLAAVALLVFYAIANALIATKRWKPSDAIVKLFINRAFALGLVALILAVGGPLLARGFNSDDLIDGTVLAQDGSTIQSATVSAPPDGPQPVDLNGSYELRVPAHVRRKQGYVVTASADGFKPETRTVAEADIGAVDFKLQPQPRHAVRQIMPELVVGQFYGVPFVIVSLKAKSPGTAQAWISDATALLSNGQGEVSLFPKLVTVLGSAGPYERITGMIPINPDVETTFRIIMAPNADADINGLLASISRLPDYRNSMPCAQSVAGSYSPLTEQAFDMIQSFAENNFVWTAGKWTLDFKITAGGQEDSLDKTFELTSADIQDLRNSVKLVKSCKSVNVTFPLAQEGLLSNYILR